MKPNLLHWRIFYMRSTRSQCAQSCVWLSFFFFKLNTLFSKLQAWECWVKEGSVHVFSLFLQLRLKGAWHAMLHLSWHLDLGELKTNMEEIEFYLFFYWRVCNSVRMKCLSVPGEWCNKGLNYLFHICGKMMLVVFFFFFLSPYSRSLCKKGKD